MWTSHLRTDHLYRPSAKPSAVEPCKRRGLDQPRRPELSVVECMFDPWWKRACSRGWRRCRPALSSPRLWTRWTRRGAGRPARGGAAGTGPAVRARAGTAVGDDGRGRPGRAGRRSRRPRVLRRFHGAGRHGGRLGARRDRRRPDLDPPHRRLGARAGRRRRAPPTGRLRRPVRRADRPRQGRGVRPAPRPRPRPHPRPDRGDPGPAAAGRAATDHQPAPRPAVAGPARDRPRLGPPPLRPGGARTDGDRGARRRRHGLGHRVRAARRRGGGGVRPGGPAGGSGQAGRAPRSGRADRRGRVPRAAGRTVPWPVRGPDHRRAAPRTSPRGPT